MYFFIAQIKLFTSKYCWCRSHTCWGFQFPVSWNKELEQRHMNSDRNRNSLIKRRKAFLGVGGNRPESWKRWEALMIRHLLWWALFSRHCLSMLSFVTCNPIGERFSGLLPSDVFTVLDFIAILLYCLKSTVGRWSRFHRMKAPLTLPQDSVWMRQSYF